MTCVCCIFCMSCNLPLTIGKQYSIKNRDNDDVWISAYYICGSNEEYVFGVGDTTPGQILLWLAENDENCAQLFPVNIPALLAIRQIEKINDGDGSGVDYTARPQEFEKMRNYLMSRNKTGPWAHAKKRAEEDASQEIIRAEEKNNSKLDEIRKTLDNIIKSITELKETC